MNRGMQREVQREICRRKFIKRAMKQKKRWISAAFRGKPSGQAAWLTQAVKCICSVGFWLGLGVFVLAVSWELFWRTGEASFSNERLVEESVIHQQEGGWMHEFFGVEIRVQDGKIVFFREKSERKEDLFFAH